MSSGAITDKGLLRKNNVDIYNDFLSNQILVNLFHLIHQNYQYFLLKFHKKNFQLQLYS